MIKKHESEAGRALAVFLILILLISNHYNFSDFYATALKFRLITNFSMLFQAMSMMHVFHNCGEEGIPRSWLYA
jgi:hypothetical protein